MAINPMQRKSRNSFLLGMFVMLLIAAVIIGLLFMQIINLKKAEEARLKITVEMLVLRNDVKSGDVITEDDIEIKVIETNVGKTSIATLNDINLKENKTAVAKIDLPKGTGLLTNMMTPSDQVLTSSTRLQEYNMITLPTDLTEGDFIDVRIMLPTGQDYIVVSKKSVVEATERVLKIELREEEIITMSNAIVEAYYMTGSKLYVTKYVEPGIQTIATPTYPVEHNVSVLIGNNPNVLAEAKTALVNRLNAGGNEQRDGVINGVLDQYSETGRERVNSKVVEEITKALEDRTSYLKNLDTSLEEY